MARHRRHERAADAAAARGGLDEKVADPQAAARGVRLETPAQERIADEATGGVRD